MFSKKSLTLISDPDANGHDSIELSGWQGTLFVLAEPDRQDWICVLDWTETTTGARMDVTSCPPSELGTYRGAITLYACADPGCSTPFPGSPFRIPYELVVRHTLRADTGGVTLWSFAGSSSEEYAVQVQLPDGASSFDLAVVEPASWLQITQHTATSFAVRAAAMPEGTYRTSLRLAAGPDVVVLPVEYVVRPLPSAVEPTHVELRLPSGARGSATVHVRLAQPDTSYTVRVLPEVVDWLRITRQTATELDLEVAPLPPGTYYACLWLRSDHSGMEVPVYVVVAPAADEPELEVTPGEVAFSASPGGSSAVQHLTVALPPWAPSFTPSVTYGSASDWLVVTPTLGGLDLQANATSLPRGAYRATLALNAYRTPERDVFVALTVVDGIVTPTNQTLPITVTTTVADLTRELPIRSTNGQVLGWAASSSWGLVTLDTPAGTTEAPLRFHVDPSKLTDLPNGSPWWDGITLRYDRSTGSDPALDFGVLLAKDLPEVRAATPSAQPAGRAMRLQVVGRGFSRVPDLAARLSVGGVAPTSVQVVDDARLVVDVPALSPGMYPVAVRNDLDTPVATAPVRVFARRSYPYARLDEPGTKHGVLFDPVEEAIYFADVADAYVVRLAFDGTGWVRSQRFMPDLQDIGLSPDGGTLIVATVHDVHLLDPTTLAERGSQSLGSGFPFLSEFLAPAASAGLLVTNEGRVFWKPNDSLSQSGAWPYYDLGSNAMSGFDPLCSASARAGSVSRDGRRAVFSGGADISPLLFADSVDGIPRLTDTYRTFTHAAQSDDGQRIILDGADLYDGQYALLGRTLLPAGYETRGAVLSPAGDRAYVVGYPASFATSATPGPRVFVFDAASPATASGFPLVRSFDVPDSPTCRQPFLCDTWPRIVLSPDESTLILAGDAGIVVAPVP